MRISKQSVDEWLDSIDDQRAVEIKHLDSIISDVFANDSRVLWVGKFWGGTDQTIIGYGDLYQPRPKGDPVHWFMVGLAVQRANISLYVNAVKDGRYLGQAYGKALGKVKLGSASIGFKTINDLDLDVMSSLLLEARTLSAR